VSSAPERACGSGDRAHHCIRSVAATSLIARNARSKAQFSEGRNFAHALDFNSLAALQ